MPESPIVRRTVWGLDIGNGQWCGVKIGLNEKGGHVRIDAITPDHFPYGGVPNFPDDCVVAILDIPIGLLDDAVAAPSKKGRSGDRDVDKGARQWCRSTSSVFPPPTTGQMETGIAEHRRASAATDESGWKRNLAAVEPQGLSKQTFELIPAIESGANLKRRYPDKVFESHPEVVFAALAGSIIPTGKTSLSGALARSAILSDRLGIDCLRWVVERECETQIDADNWLDALAMGVVAIDWRMRHGRNVISCKTGNLELWGGQSEGIMALPANAPKKPPHLQSRIEMIERIFKEGHARKVNSGHN